MPTKDELPGVDREELNEMIRDLGREKGLPPGIHPDLIGPDEDYHGYWGYGQEERHKQSVAVRRALIAELQRRADWITAWRADKMMDQRVRELCEEKGLQFAPWERPPWAVRVGDELPSRNDNWAASMPLALRLRRQLEAEIRAQMERTNA